LQQQRRKKVAAARLLPDKEVEVDKDEQSKKEQ
jgi:hypothetical protein